jgi:hypothetical protein
MTELSRSIFFKPLVHSSIQKNETPAGKGVRLPYGQSRTGLSIIQGFCQKCILVRGSAGVK